MGHRGIYKVVVDGREAAYYTHWGVASPFSIFRRLLCVLELKEGQHADKSLIEIFGNIGENGDYMPDSDKRDKFEMHMFEQLSVRQKRGHRKDFDCCGYLEMWVTLNFDSNTAFIEHNPRYSFYKYVGNYFIPLDQGIHNIKAVLNYATDHGLDDVREVAGAFHRHTGMEDVYQLAKNMEKAEENGEKIIENYAINPYCNKENLTFPHIGEKLRGHGEDDGLER